MNTNKNNGKHTNFLYGKSATFDMYSKLPSPELQISAKLKNTVINFIIIHKIYYSFL